jgi:predicted permease
MSFLAQDLRLALRLLVSRAGFSAVVIATLALGIGANTALFGLVHAALFRAPAIRDPGSLVNLYTSREDGSGYGALSYPDFSDIAGARGAFEEVFGYSGLMATRTGEGQAESVFGEIVTGNYFRALGVSPAVGRFFLAEEDRTPGTHPVVVLGYRYWQQRFGGDTAVVGREIFLGGRPFTVVGVAPAEFRGMLFRGFSVDVWAPVMMMGALRTDQLATRGERWMFTKARLRPGATIDAARAQMDALSARLAVEHPGTNTGRHFRAIPASDVLMNPDSDRPLVAAVALLLGAVGLVLLIACGNLANMLLARGVGRRREIAVRIALGASRARLVRQLTTEVVVLVVLGGAAGLLVARWLVALLVAFRPPLPVALTFDVRVDWSVAGYAVVLSALTALLVGVLPALHATRADLASTMREHTLPGRRRGRPGLRQVLLLPQVAFSVTLVALAGLAVRSVSRAGAVDPGFDLAHTAVLALQLGASGYDDARAARFHAELRRRIVSLPGVRAVAVTDRIPLDLYGNQSAAFAADDAAGGDVPQVVQHAGVGPDYFDALGIRLTSGRAFDARDERDGAAVAVVNRAAADRTWPGRDPLGRRVRLGEDGPWLEVVGVAADAKVSSLGEQPTPLVYRPLVAGRERLLRVVVATTGDPRTLPPSLRRIVGEIDRDVAVFESRTMRESLGAMLFPFRMAAWIGSALGAFSLVLAAVGLYGVLALAVSSRRRELAIRRALGARGRDVATLVLREGAAVVLAGLALGLVMALALAHALGAWLFGIAPADPGAFGGTLAVLAIAALAAALVPLREALRAPPMRAMREE